MRTTITSLVAFLAVSAAVLNTANASGCGGNNGGGGNYGGNGGGYLGGGNLGGGYGGGYNNNNNCQTNGGYPLGGYPNNQPYGQAYEPFHSWYICQPGDAFYTVSLKEYGTSAVANQIARFNRLAANAALVPGQRLMLPSVSANGQLSQSRAPAPFVDGGVPNSVGTPTAHFARPQASVASSLASSVKVAATEPALPNVTVGSTLMLDGQVFGDEQGTARLRVGGLSLPIEVLEWTSSTAKVRLPQVELTSAMGAEIEVLRADGSLASKSGINLTPADARLARSN
jgi:hypothetical protein